MTIGGGSQHLASRSPLRSMNGSSLVFHTNAFTMPLSMSVRPQTPSSITAATVRSLSLLIKNVSMPSTRLRLSSGCSQTALRRTSISVSVATMRWPKHLVSRSSVSISSAAAATIMQSVMSLPVNCSAIEATWSGMSFTSLPPSFVSASFLLSVALGRGPGSGAEYESVARPVRRAPRRHTPVRLLRRDLGGRRQRRCHPVQVAVEALDQVRDRGDQLLVVAR